MDNISARLVRLRPEVIGDRLNCRVVDGQIEHWNENVLGPRPTDEELLGVDIRQPKPEETKRARAIEILKADVPDTWKDSTNAQQRIAWAMKRLFVEVRSELKE